MGLGIVRGSLISACADATGDSSDDVVKIRRLINEKGPEFCELAPFPFLYSDTSFSITSAAYKYSGASYLPTTFKRIVGAFLLDGTTRCPLDEENISEAYLWPNPDDNQGRPNKFCITRIESGYWEIQFNRLPDNTYTVYLEIELQWADVTSDSAEVIITKRYFPQFAHFLKMARYIQQGDTENYQIAYDQWDNPLKPRSSILSRLLASLSNPLKKKSVVVNKMRSGSELPTIKSDYGLQG